MTQLQQSVETDQNMQLISPNNNESLQVQNNLGRYSSVMEKSKDSNNQIEFFKTLNGLQSKKNSISQFYQQISECNSFPVQQLEPKQQVIQIEDQQRLSFDTQLHSKRSEGKKILVTEPQTCSQDYQQSSLHESQQKYFDSIFGQEVTKIISKQQTQKYFLKRNKVSRTFTTNRVSQITEAPSISSIKKSQRSSQNPCSHLNPSQLKKAVLHKEALAQKTEEQIAANLHEQKKIKQIHNFMVKGYHDKKQRNFYSCNAKYFTKITKKQQRGQLTTQNGMIQQRNPIQILNEQGQLNTITVENVDQKVKNKAMLINVGETEIATGHVDNFNSSLMSNPNVQQSQNTIGSVTSQFAFKNGSGLANYQNEELAHFKNLYSVNNDKHSFNICKPDKNDSLYQTNRSLMTRTSVSSHFRTNKVPKDQNMRRGSIQLQNPQKWSEPMPGHPITMHQEIVKQRQNHIQKKIENQCKNFKEQIFQKRLNSIEVQKDIERQEFKIDESSEKVSTNFSKATSKKGQASPLIADKQRIQEEQTTLDPSKVANLKSRQLLTADRSSSCSSSGCSEDNLMKVARNAMKQTLNRKFGSILDVDEDPDKKNRMVNEYRVLKAKEKAVKVQDLFTATPISPDAKFSLSLGQTTGSYQVTQMQSCEHSDRNSQDEVCDQKRGSIMFFENINRGLSSQKNNVNNDIKEFIKTDHLLKLNTNESELQKQLEEKLRGDWASAERRKIIEQSILLSDQLIKKKIDNKNAIINKIQGIKHDPSTINSRTKNKVKSLRNCLDKIKLIRIVTNIKEEKEDFKKYYKETFFIRQVLDQDNEFRRMLDRAFPETKLYLNSILTEMMDEELYKVQLVEDQIEQIENLKTVMAKMIGNQEKKKEASVTRLLTNDQFDISLFKSEFDQKKARQISKIVKKSGSRYKNQGQTFEEIMTPQSEENEIKITAMSTLRKLYLNDTKYKRSHLQFQIEKHFMTGFPHSLKKKKKNCGSNGNGGGIDFLYLGQLAGLCSSLEECFPNNGTIGQKYFKSSTNMFENEIKTRNEDQYKLNLYGQSQLTQLDDGWNKDMAELSQDSYDSEEEKPQKAGEEIQIDKVFKKHLDIEKNLDILFKKEINKKKFYEETKNPRENKKSSTSSAVMKFFHACQDSQIVPIPTFMDYVDGNLYLVETTIGVEQAKAIKAYLEKTKDDESKHVKSLIIDSCQMKDEAFSTILKGIINQSKTVTVSVNNRNSQKLINTTVEKKLMVSLKKIVYCNNYIGPQSLQQIIRVLPYLTDLEISNVHTGMSQTIHKQLTQSIYNNGANIQKLRLSNVNLDDEKIIDLIIETIQTNKQHLQNLDFSWCSLNPKHLARLAQEFKENPYIVKNLNLSYNQLVWKKNYPGYEDSQLFVKNMVGYLSITDMLNHLSIQGMNFTKSQLIALSNVMNSCPNLLAIHLSDNGILRAEELMLDILEIFSLGSIDIKDICRAKYEGEVSESFDNCEHVMHSRDKQIRVSTTEIQTQFEKNHLKHVSDQVQKRSSTIDQREQFGRKLYNSHILQYQTNQHIRQNRQRVQAETANGLGRSKDGDVDQFVLTRHVNHPELVFNQDTNKDQFKQNRYFEVDSGDFWRLSQKNECYVCDKHQYTVICFDRGNLNNNKDLQEIKDKAFVRKLKQEYKSDPANKNVFMPQVRGSVVNGNQNKFPFQRLAFDRKLRMMRSDIYAALLISNSTLFLKTLKQSKQIKTGLVKTVQMNNMEQLEQVNVIDKFKGSNRVMYDFIFKNQLTDLKTVNVKADTIIRANQETSKDLFVYSAYLPPGAQNVLIYCPKTERAFIKQFYTGINDKDFYPELPGSINAGQRTKNVQNMWRQWVEDTEQSFAVLYNLEISSPHFEPELIVKDPAEVQKVKEVVLENFETITQYFIIKIGMSEKFPKVDYYSAMSIKDDIAKTTDQNIIMIEQIEISYVRASRLNKEKGIKGQLRRAQFMDLIVRLSKQAFEKIPESIAVQQFIQNHLQPFVEMQKIKSDRRQIRFSAKLNELINDNKGQLKTIFDVNNGSKNNFNLDAAVALVSGINDVGNSIYNKRGLMTILPINNDIVKKLFVYSQMTIKDETTSFKKYGYLLLVEFYEFLCRVAMQTIQIKDTIEVKVYAVFELIFEFHNKLMEKKIQEEEQKKKEAGVEVKTNATDKDDGIVELQPISF